MSEYSNALHRAADFIAANEELIGITYREGKAVVHIDTDDIGFHLHGDSREDLVRKLIAAIKVPMMGDNIYISAQEPGTFLGFFDVTIFTTNEIVESIFGVDEDHLIGLGDDVPDTEFHRSSEEFAADMALDPELVSA